MENKPGEVFVAFAEGFRRVFDLTLKNGIYIDYLLAAFLSMFTGTLINAKHLTLADRRAIKEYLEPYVHKIPMLPVSKVCTEQEAKMWYELPREVILHPENFDRGRHTQSVWNGEGTLAVLNSLNNIFLPIAGGISATTLTMSGVFFGEKDKDSLRKLLKILLTESLPITLITAAITYMNV